MPVIYRTDATAARRKDLVAELRREWESGAESTAAEPVIIVEESSSGDLLPHLHLLVVWGRWAEVEDGRERYSIVMEAFRSLASTEPEQILSVAKVTALTPEQARAEGIDFDRLS